MVYSLVVDSDLQGWCGDYCGSMGGIEQQTMVGSAGKGVGSQGFCCSPSGGGSACMDGLLLNTAHTPQVVATPVLHATNDH